MNKLNKRGFTLTELVIVLAIIAVLAAVLIPTFAGLIRKANDSAYQQERTNQMIQDEIEKIEKGSDNYMSWEDFEEAIAKALKDQDSGNLADKIIAIIKDNDKETGLTDEQLTKILEAIANKKFSDTQVKVILEGVQSGNASLTKEQIDQIIAKLPQVGITQEDIAAAVKEVLGNGSDLANAINAAVTAAVEKIPTLSKDDITRIIEEVLAVNLEKDGKYVARIGATGYATLQAAVDAAETGDIVVLTADIAPDAAIMVEAGKNFTIDLNEHSITQTNYYEEGEYYHHAFDVYGTLILQGDGIVTSTGSAVRGRGGSNITINGGTYTGNCAVRVTTGTVKITDGTFNGTADNSYMATITAEEGTYLTIDNGTFNTKANNTVQRVLFANNDSKITINNGTFNGLYTDAYDISDIYVGDCDGDDAFVINGATFNCTVSTNMKLTIENGTFNGQIYTSAISPSAVTLTVNGGSFNLTEKQIKVSGNSWRIAINGGTFAATRSNYYTNKVGNKTYNGTATVDENVVVFAEE